MVATAYIQEVNKSKFVPQPKDNFEQVEGHALVADANSRVGNAHSS